MEVRDKGWELLKYFRVEGKHLIGQKEESDVTESVNTEGEDDLGKIWYGW